MNREDQLLSAILRDKFRQCEKRSCHTWSGFLTPAEAAEAESVCRSLGADFVLEGGYEDAERRICVFRPKEFWDEPEPLKVLRISVLKGSPALSHRDYLGSLLGLGIERSVVGDILVREDGADAVVLSDMADGGHKGYRRVPAAGQHLRFGLQGGARKGPGCHKGGPRERQRQAGPKAGYRAFRGGQDITSGQREGCAQRSGRTYPQGQDICYNNKMDIDSEGDTICFYTR